MAIYKNTAKHESVYYGISGLGVSGYVSKDGAASGLITGTITEQTGGLYDVALSSGDMNADDITLIVTAAGLQSKSYSYHTETFWTTGKAAYITGPVALEATSQTLTGSLSNLDAPITSRALSGTALSSAQWTNALTGIINTNLDVKVSSRTACAIWTDLKATYIDVPITSRVASATWTDLKAGYLTGPVALEATSQTITGTLINLDAPITSRALSGTALSSDQWTNALTGKLNTNIDAPITSRALSGTALSSAVWTPTIAGYLTGPVALESTSQTITGSLSNLDAPITSRALSGTALSSLQWTNALTGIINTNLDAKVSSRTACAIWTDLKASYVDASIANLQSDVTDIYGFAQNTNTAIVYLDAPITSRALSGTALSSDQWTNALTGVINTNLDTKVSSRTACAIWTDLKATYIDVPLTSRASSAALSVIGDNVGTIGGIVDGHTTTLLKLDVPITSRTASATWTDLKAGYLTGLVALEATSQTITGTLIKLDVPITSRALSGTALLNTDWTVARATNLDAPITSRALSGTALSTSQWTNALTGILNTNLDTSISSRASSSVQASGQVKLDQFVFTTPYKVDATAGALASGDITSISNSVTASLAVGGVTIAPNGLTSASISGDAVTLLQAGLALSGTALSNLVWTATKANYIDVAISSRSSGAIVASSGTTDITWTHRVVSYMNVPLSGILVQYYTDITRATLAEEGYTDINGEVVFVIAAGTYYSKTIIPGIAIKKETIVVS